MNQFEQHIIATVRSMPDAAILDLVKHNLGGVNAAEIEATPKTVPRMPPVLQGEKMLTPKRAARKPLGVAKTGKPVSQRAAGGKARATGEKRSADQLAHATDMVMTHITDLPGQGSEQIGKELQMTTRELALPIRKLLAAKKIKTTGAKRATKYYPS